MATLRELGEEISEIKADISDIKVTLTKQSVILDTHIARSERLETLVESQRQQWNEILERSDKAAEQNRKFTIKLLAGIGTFVGIVIPLIVTLLNALK